MDENEEILERKMNASLLAELAGLDEDMCRDYATYRQKEFDLLRFLWERPGLINLVMAVNKNAVFMFPYIPLKGSDLPSENP